MGSPNKHWPSLFKSKPCNNHQNQYQWQNHHLISSSSSERCPEARTRWNPKVEQIRILEAIFNSGMVNPPRDEIRRIRIQLQEYGQVGDANVFYWFQNRKSRTKQKIRTQLIPTPATANPSKPTSPPPITAVGATFPSAPSSSGSTGTPAGHLIYQASTHEQNYHEHLNLITPTLELPPSFCPNNIISTHDHDSNMQVFGGGFGFPEVIGPVQMAGVLNVSSPTPSSSSSAITTLPSSFNNNNILGNEIMSHEADTSLSTMISLPDYNIMEELGIGPVQEYHKYTVFINNVAFELMDRPLNVREAFGADAILIFTSGQPVLMDEWGVTLQSLQPGSSYYLMSTTFPSIDDIDATCWNNMQDLP